MNSTVLYTGIAVVLAIIVVVFFFFFPNYLQGMSSGAQSSALPNQENTAAQPSTQSNLLVQDTAVGTGATAEPGDQVQVEYIGKLQDGTIFDQSSNHGGSFTFVLGAGQVIPGWDQGLVGMKVGGERILTIPPDLAYGNQQAGTIPPNSTLVFDVKLIGVTPASSSTSPQGTAAQ